MAFISLENLKKNLNIGWLLLIAYFILMAIIYLIANPQMPLGTEIYVTALVLLIIGLSLEG